MNVGDKCRRNVLLSCDHGLMIVNRFDCNHEQVGHGQWLLDHGNASTLDASVCCSSISEVTDPVIFDVGANMGTFTTWLANSFPTGRVYAFEPQRAVFQILCGNMAINNLYNVYPYNFALGAEETTVEFDEPNYFSKEDFGTFSLKEQIIKNTSNKLVVEVHTLDWFFSRYKVPKLDLLKIDAEGMDMDVLRGAINTIEQFKPIIFIEHCDNRKSIIKQITDFLDQFSYEYQIIGNNVLSRSNA